MAAFPEFNDASKYPGTQREFWLNIATANLSSDAWGQYYVLGVYLWVAHHLTLFGNRKQGSGGKNAGGLVSSKSVGGVSISYDTGSVTQPDAGQWNMTTYGNRWLDLARMVGAGGAQVGYGPIPQYTGLGWPGPSGYG